LNRGKLAVVVATGIGRGGPGLEQTGQQIRHALTLEGMEVLGQVKVEGNPECLVCGHGETCPMSALPRVFGLNPKVAPEMFRRVEDQAEAWNKARDLGLEIARRLRENQPI
jgi:hypothetical protein